MQGRLAAQAHKIVLEGERALIAVHNRAHGLVADRQHRRGDAKASRKIRAHLAEAQAACEQLATQQMQCNVAVAEREPAVALEPFQLIKHAEAFVRAAPALLLMHDAGEREEHGVEVRATRSEEHTSELQSLMRTS